MTSLRWRIAAVVLLSVLLGMGAMYGGLVLGRRTPPAPANARMVVCVVKDAGGASWVRTPGGGFIVIGAGAQADALLASLKSAGAKSVELLILPTSSPEQIGGAAKLMDTLTVRNVLENGLPPFDKPAANDDQYRARLRLTQKHIPVLVARAGQTLQVGMLRVEILAPLPPRAESVTAGAGRAVRDDALVVRLVHGATAFVWNGGLTKRGETELLGRAPTLSAVWLFFPAGYGIERVSPEFLRLVSPEYCVVDGEVADFDSRLETRMRATGARTSLTGAAAGDLRFESDGKDITAIP